MSHEKKYDIALSFAGEDRAVVELVAQALKARGVEVFYDAFETSELWGKNLYTHLSDVFQRARYCIPFLSAAYAKKLWTTHELQAIQAQAFTLKREYLLPVRLDDTPVSGIFGTISFLSIPPASPQDIAMAAYEKLGLPCGGLVSASVREIVTSWKECTSGSDAQGRRLIIVVGGSDKYDKPRKEFAMKPYQSTEPVTGVVRVALALEHFAPGLFRDAFCDYNRPQAGQDGTPLDVIAVGGGDTNKLCYDIFLQDAQSLPVRFTEANSSEYIVAPATHERWSEKEHGFVLGLRQPLSGIRFAVICAGNGATGTNAALSMLARWLTDASGAGSTTSLPECAVVENTPAGPKVLWRLG